MSGSHQEGHSGLCVRLISLRNLTFFYLICSVVSVALTGYVLVAWRIALPSFDVIEYHEFLAAAANGILQWDELWSRHNGVHLIFLPKLIFFFDMWLGGGAGIITTLASLVTILFTVALFVRAIFQFHTIGLSEKYFFSVLAFFVMTSDIMLESLLNPVDIQWSLLAMGSVLLAYGLSLFGNRNFQAGWFHVLSGILISWLSAGPLSLMLLAALVTGLLTVMNSVVVRMRFALGIMALSCVAVSWEFAAWVLDGELLLPWLIRPVVIPADWHDVAAKFLHENPGYYWSLGYKWFAFVGDFIGLPVIYTFSIASLSIVVFLMWLFLVAASSRSWNREYIFFVYLIVFPFLIGLAAGLFRSGDLYSYRHANMGFLLQVSSFLLVYVAFAGRYRILCFALFMFVYGAVFMRVAVSEAGEWAAWGRETLRLTQIGDAIGVNDASWFKYVWKFGWREAEAQHSKQVFREKRVGIYASTSFRRYADQLPLPLQQIDCDYILKDFSQVRTDHRAFMIHGAARTMQGSSMPEVVFVGQDGKYLGYGLSEMPTHNLFDQLQMPWGWGGYVFFDGKPLPAAVTVIAFDDDKHCQPWSVPLPANTQRE